MPRKLPSLMAARSLAAGLIAAAHFATAQIPIAQIPIAQILIAQTASAQSGDQSGDQSAGGDAGRGREIARAMHAANAGFGDERVSGTLTIEARDGTTATRQFRMVTLERADAGDKRAVIFSAPAALDGFVSLNHTRINAPDNQWIYLPRLRTTRRLASRDKSGSLAGSDFTYEDILRFEFARYTYDYLGEGECGDGHTCQKVAFDPRYEYSAYSTLVQFIDMDLMRPRKIVYYGRTGDRVKVLHLSDFEQYGSYWRSHVMRMENLRTGSVSTIRWETWRFGTGLSTRDFSVQRIEAWAR